MAKRCLGLTWGFNRCENDRGKLPVCKKHIWQLVQIIVILVTTGSIIVTVELVKVFESRVAILEGKKNAIVHEAELQPDNDKPDKQYDDWGNLK